LWTTSGGFPAENDVWFPGYSEPQGWMGLAPFVKYKLSGQNPTKQKMMRLTVPEAIMEGRDEYLGDGICGESLEQQFKVNRYPVEGEVKMFYRYGGSYIGTMVDTNKWVKLYQSDKLECVVNQDCWFSGETRFADIILPACTNMERDDVGEWAGAGGYAPNGHMNTFWRVIVREQKCIEPLGESKSDYEIFTSIAGKLGMKELYTDDGKTELDWCRLFFESSDLHKKGLITWEEFNEKGYYIVPVPENYEPHPQMRWFQEGKPNDTKDPYNPNIGTDKSHLLGTYTGKIEFVSESLRALAPEDDERPLTPKHIPSWEGRGSELFKKYPLQMISPHPRFSFHTHYDKHSSWLDEIPGHRVIIDGYAYWPARINPGDALERGIGKGDIVELYNDRGSVLCAAVVTDRVPRGVVHS
jgi:trimethylamine-N-oxide reductase (cytochrome c)